MMSRVPSPIELLANILVPFSLYVHSPLQILTAESKSDGNISASDRFIKIFVILSNVSSMF